LTAANGGLTLSDITSYDKNKAGNQTLGLALDDKNISFKVFVLDVEPTVWFDFGYMRHEGDPQGYGLGEGKFYTMPNVPLVLAPARYLIGWNNDYSPASGTTYSWSVTSPSGGAYDTAAAANKETFAFKPSVAGTYTVKVSVTGRDFITGGTSTKEASVPVVCGTGKIPAAKTWNANGYDVRLLRNFAPGQFTVSGNGLGWSLGGIGGYAVWDAKQHLSSYQVAGNAFGTSEGGWNEPGIVWVQEDNNGNGLPDEMWYEIRGGVNFYVKDAMDAAGNPVTLTNVRFIKAQTAVFRYGGIFGEVSTEITVAAGFNGHKMADF
jgi:hypothetical protein